MDDRKTELAALLDIPAKQGQISNIKEQMADPGFWLDHEKAGKVAQELRHLEDVVTHFELAESESDLDELEQEAFYGGDHDDASAYISVHAGAGGTEAQDWAEMLLRMYQRYAEKEDYKIQLLDKSDGEEAGIKSATFAVKGFRAYGNLKGEAGVHRLVRISPFDADKARHTSFALVEVVPEVENVSFKIHPDEIRVDVYRAGGHGGQGVNTTDSAVRITHLATKIVVTCQNERSQLQNKLQALKILEAKLQLLEDEKRLEAEQKIKGEPVLASWGNQIRSYVMQPYQLVKDNRTGFETAAVNEVLDGELSAFIEAYLKYNFKKKHHQE